MADEIQTYAVPVPPEVTQSIESALAQASTIEVIDDKTLNEATAVLANLTQAQRKAEEARVFLVKPLKEHAKAIDAVFKNKKQPIDDVIRSIKAKVAGYQNQQQAKAREAQQRLDEQAAAEKAAADFMGTDVEIVAPTVAAPSAAIHTFSGSAVTKKRWTYEVVDVAALAAYAAANGPMGLDKGEQMDRADLIEPNKGALRKAVNGGWRDIPGVRIFQVDDVSVSPR